MAIPTTLRIAWRNLGRNRKRTALALLAIGAAQVALIFTDSLMHGYSDSMIDAVTGPLIGHAQVHAPKWRDEYSMDLVLDDLSEQMNAVRRTEGVSTASARIYAPALAALGEEGHVVVVIGANPSVESQEGGLLTGVRPSRLPKGHRVVVGAALAHSMGVRLGDEIAIVGQAADGSIANDLYTVGHILTSPVGEVQQRGIVMPLSAAQELFVMPDEAHEITIRGSEPESAPALARRLATLPELRGEEVLPWQRIVPELVSLVELIDRSSIIIVLLVFIAATAGIANTMLMATFERTHELGMLVALGTTPVRIVRMIVAEATILGLAGVGAGTLVGMAIVAITSQSGIDLTTFGNEAARELSFQGLNYQFDIVPRVQVTDIVEGVLGVLVTSLIASLWPALHAARLHPVEAMRA